MARDPEQPPHNQHASSPRYRRNRRNGEQKIEREEKQALRRSAQCPGCGKKAATPHPKCLERLTAAPERASGPAHARVPDVIHHPDQLRIRDHPQSWRDLLLRRINGG